MCGRFPGLRVKARRSCLPKNRSSQWHGGTGATAYSCGYSPGFGVIEDIDLAAPGSLLPPRKGHHLLAAYRLARAIGKKFVAVGLPRAISFHVDKRTNIVAIEAISGCVATPVRPGRINDDTGIQPIR